MTNTKGDGSSISPHEYSYLGQTPHEYGTKTALVVGSGSIIQALEQAGLRLIDSIQPDPTAHEELAKAFTKFKSVKILTSSQSMRLNHYDLIVLSGVHAPHYMNLAARAKIVILITSHDLYLLSKMRNMLPHLVEIDRLHNMNRGDRGMVVLARDAIPLTTIPVIETPPLDHNGLRFMTITNSGYIDFAINLMVNFQEPHLAKQSLVVECLDTASFDYLSVYSFPNVRVIHPTKESVNPGFHEYDTQTFKDICSRKLELIRYHLETVRTLWYIDSDIVFLRDPLPFIRDDVDILFQSDGVPLRQAYGTNQCAGNMLIRHTEQSLNFIDRVIKLQLDNPQTVDQKVLSAHLESVTTDIRQYPLARLDILPPTRFPSGWYAFKYEGKTRKHRREHEAVVRDAVAIHANFLVGRVPKIEALRKVGAWFLGH